MLRKHAAPALTSAASEAAAPASVGPPRPPRRGRHPSEAPSRQATPASVARPPASEVPHATATAAVTATDSELGKTSNTAKNKIQKIREINGSYLFFQEFDKFWIWSARNDRKRKLCEFAETCLEKLVKSLLVNFFSAGFRPVGTTVRLSLWGRRFDFWEGREEILLFRVK